MVKAFICGKFLPFHKGHEAMIRFALSKSDFLTVLVCCSDKETIPGNVRKSWMEKTFESRKDIEIRCYHYSESELPNTSVSSPQVSKVWAERFKALFPDYDLVISSEKYGDYIASFMGIKHIAFDIPRQSVLVSATAVRNDLVANWDFLPDHVKPDFAIKVVILGTESTGKTTLTEKLAKHYNCASVKEAGRDIIADSTSFLYDDLHLVASEHARRINEATTGKSPLIIIDTDIHITKSYSNFVFGRTLEVDSDIYNANKAQLHLYLNNDVKYVQDGTRLDETKRDLLDLSHREILRQHNIDLVEIRGNWEQRFERAVEEIDRIIRKEKL